MDLKLPFLHDAGFVVSTILSFNELYLLHSLGGMLARKSYIVKWFSVAIQFMYILYIYITCLICWKSDRKKYKMMICSKPKDCSRPNRQVVMHPRKQGTLDEALCMSRYQLPGLICCWGTIGIFFIRIEISILGFILIKGEPNCWP